MRGHFLFVEPRPLLFGHRGYSSLAPENTLASFALSAAHSVPGIELDVRQCRSGELVVIHDENLKRVTGFDGLVEETPLQTLKTFDAGRWFGDAFTGERIPLLEEVFAVLKDTVYYDIEIKHKKRHAGTFEKTLVDIVFSFGLQRRCMISSFNPFALRTVRKLTKDLPTALIFSNHNEVPFGLRHGEGLILCRSAVLKPHYTLAKPLSLTVQSMLGYPVIPWTVNDAEHAERLIKNGAAGIISDCPGALLCFVHP